MVIRLLIVTFALSGCLSKPDRLRAAPGDGGSDGGSDGGMDAPPDHLPCDASTEFPVGLVIEGPPKVFDVDGDTRDDVIVFGRKDGSSAAYLLLGRDAPVLDCYDVKYVLSGPQIIFDVWVGDLVGDAKAEIALIGTDKPDADDDGTPTFRAELFVGSGDGPPSANFTRELVGDYVNGVRIYEPRFIVGVRGNGSVGAHLVFGGVNPPFGAFPVQADGTLLTGNTMLETVGNTNFWWGDMEYQQHVWGHVAQPTRLLAATQGTARDAELGTQSRTFTLLPAQSPAPSFGVNMMRFGRTWHRVLLGDQTVAAVSDVSGYFLVSYNTEFTVRMIDRTNDGQGVLGDMSMGQLHGVPEDMLDFVVLWNDSPARQLTIHPDLDFTKDVGNGFDDYPRVSKQLLQGDHLAVGNFSLTSEGDEILVLDRTLQGTTAGACYRVNAGVIVDCVP